MHVTNTHEVEVQEVLREHFAECLKHFADRFRTKWPHGKKGLAKARKPIADFCDVNESAVKDWLSYTENPRPPVGETEVRLKCFLDLNGYRVIELERLSRTVRNFAELIGFGLLSGKNAGELLGYKNPGNLYPVLRGDEEYGGVSKEREAKMFDLWKEKKDELEQRKREAAKRYRVSFSRRIATKPILIVSPVETNVAGRRSATLKILEGSLALLGDGLFDKLSESELAALKESHGTIILQLSARLSALGLKLTTGEQE
jgi:hypothetical protein